MSKFPPCMMMPQYAQQPKKAKEVNFLKQYMEFQKFIKEIEKDKKDAEKKPETKGKWQQVWVEEPVISKWSTLETMAILLLLSIPVAFAEVYAGTSLFKWALG